MRITKVVLAFFSIGFLAGSFERAAGLGVSDLSEAARDRAASAALRRNTASVLETIGTVGTLPEELRPQPRLAPGDTPPEVSAGLAEALAHAIALTPAAFAPNLPLELRAPLQDKAGMPRRDPWLRRASLSEPDAMALSRVPPPWSFPVPWFDEPARPNGGSDQVARQEAPGPEFILPFERGRVTSLYHQGRYHPAIDLAGALGSRVHATTRRQRVIFVGWRNGYGNTVVTRDDVGRTHLYGHLQRTVVKVGTVLEQGQMLGALGSTGRSTGPHVHYELKTRSGAHVDPVSFLFGRRIGRGYAWNGSRSLTRYAARGDQPRPR